MSDEFENKAPKSAPLEPLASEVHTDDTALDLAALWELAATPPASRSALPPGPLSQAPVAERLARWDELPPDELIQLHRDPHLGGQLGLLQRADDWLLSGGQSAEPCPNPEALFEFAGAPGAASLADEAHSQVAAHLAQCAACAGLVHSLADVPSAALLEGRPPTPQLRLLQGGALVAAAAALVMTIGPSLMNGLGGSNNAWPTAQVLRGPEQGPLLAPGGSLLATELSASWSKLPIFHLRKVQGASAYRVSVLKTTGGAFDLGQPMLDLQSAEPRIPSEASFEPGHYTWEAWATVDGREILLGTCDFRMRADAEAKAIAEAAQAAEGGARVRILEEAGLFVDARLAAEALPASAERDAYLARIER
ncbi:MAG: hypothetical protein ACI8QC_000799 [Planctomycetota bacterium]|jgi:hypothetical protein